jgi:hypothetical protein
MVAYIKIGQEFKGYTWTGKRWVKTPERTAEKVSLKKKIAEDSEKLRFPKLTADEAKKKYPGGEYRPATPAKKPAPSSAKSRLQGTTNQTAKFIKGKKPETTPTPTTTPQPIASTSSKSSSSSSSSSKANKPATKKPVVSQSKTMYVKKGDMVNGKEVKKGYVAQYGKPERKVTGVVKLVVDTTRGKAGSKVEVKKGRYNKKGK